MRVPSHADAFEVLCLRMADEGRDEALLGGCASRVRQVVRPYMIGERFPSIYLEFPLIGDPFLDVTILYNVLAEGDVVADPAAEGTESMLAWYESLDEHLEDGTCCGYELDTHLERLPPAAVHFQPGSQHELVEPFCAAVGEPERAQLFHAQHSKMPEGWGLSFFGMFRGRPQAPLRVCGYLSQEARERCAGSPQELRRALDHAGFSAYNEALLKQASELLSHAPGTVDYQMDVYPDGTLGDTFAFDLQFGIAQPELVHEAFASGKAGEVMAWLEAHGIADARWRQAIDATFARAVPVELDDGSLGSFAFTVMPQWVKVRWKAGVLQPSKLYVYANAQLLKRSGGGRENASR